MNSEFLALGVAQEWACQKDLVMLSQMHLNGLSNVCIDNPTKATKQDLVDNILNFLDTDTILFFSDDPPALLEKQENSTILKYSVEAQIGGKLAQLGSRLIDSTSKKLAGKFFDNFVKIVGGTTKIEEEKNDQKKIT